jgi:hypothetical protein
MLNQRFEKPIAPTRIRKKNFTNQKTNITYGNWTRREDEMIINYIVNHGEQQWNILAEMIGNRTGKQCRERWKNHLDPSICKDQWKESEDQLIIKSVKKNGTKWAAISKLLPGRTDNDVKNRWYSVLNRRKTNEINAKSPERKIEREPEQSSEIISLHSSVILDLPGFHDN